jgi:hypothetical protein
MGPWLLLLILALVAFVMGFAPAANWLFIIAVVLLVAGLIHRVRLPPPSAVTGGPAAPMTWRPAPCHPGA